LRIILKNKGIFVFIIHKLTFGKFSFKFKILYLRFSICDLRGNIEIHLRNGWPARSVTDCAFGVKQNKTERYLIACNRNI